MKKQLLSLPKKYKLYDPQNEKDSCGIGFIANIKSKSSYQITKDALQMLARMDHRGGCGCEENTGDGAGILTNIPHDFFKTEIKKLFNVTLENNRYSVGNVFLPQDSTKREFCMQTLKKIIAKERQILVGWRDVPIDGIKANIGYTAKQSQPVIKQLIIASDKNIDNEAFERALFVIRKYSSKIIQNDNRIKDDIFYICSLSSRTIVYKGMLIGSQLINFYTDLANKNYKTYLAMIHSRFSTNTFPSWDRAQPCRYMSHNGEINTRQGNYNRILAREGVIKSDLFQDNLDKTLPIIEKDVSDSGGFDNVLEYLAINNRSLQESILMMIPEAWQNDLNMDPNKRAFYEYLSNIMEPWDGPASITFTDGKYIGATLDRNGLRPSRFYLTKDDRVIMASEVGVVDIDAENVKHKGRLQPGKMFLIDFSKGKLIEDEDIKQGFANKKNYKKWISNQQITLDQIELNQKLSNGLQKDIINKLSFFSYSIETFQFMLLPLVTELRDPVGSMGNDSALACLSDKPRMIYDYFKQLFAQVTNPAIDSIREEVVMSLRCSIGPEANLLISEEKSAHRIVIDNPILTNKDFAKLKHINYMGWSSYVIDITYDINKANKFTNILDKICKEGLDAIKKGYSLLILSDKNVNKNRAAIPSLLAGGSLHQYLITKHARTKTGIIVETGEAREVHHFCSLIGFGVDAVNPYLAFDALSQARIDNMLDIESDEIIVNRYRKAIAKGMLKVMAKIGISTLESYKGAQIFEAIGLDDEVIDKCFCKTVSRVGGVGFDILQLETEKRHKESYANDSLSNSGLFHWRAGGEKHMWEPRTIFNLQTASRNYDINSYKEFSHHAQQQTNDCTLRGLMTFKKAKKIKLEEVEPAKEIVKRFSTGAMSFGSISAESHETLAIAMNRLEGKSNTGEGGEDSSRWERDTNGDSRRSAIKQVASGRFGVTIEYLNNSDEIQIKISQGAKPGEGGELPGKKVDEKIAKIRHSTPGVGLISPPPHHDIYSIEDLAQLIFDLKCSNPIARISVKLVSGVGVGTIAAGVVKAKADHIVIAGHDGGTGASPLTSIKHAGLPWELGLAETHQTLVMNNLRSRVIIQTDGQLKTGNDVAIAALLGAEEFGFSTAPLIVSGCIMMRKCHLNTCPVGIATQDEELRKKFTGKPEYLVNYFFMVAEELRGIMAELGFKNLNDMIGRSDMLSVANTEHWKKSTINLDDLFKSSQKNKQNIGNFNTIKQDHKLNLQIDNKLIVKAKKAIQNNENIVINEKINNQDRAVGAILSSHIIKTRKQNNMQDDTVRIKFNGSAGQSFGAFLAKGVTLEVEGDANDYVGKGLSGGKIIVYPPKKSSFDSHNEVIAGNVCVYGATNGEIYLSGRAAERFCVRNSGAMAVVEGIGDHGCEYMTGGIAIILGEVGRNFGAGMSGGIAYIYDKNNTFKKMYNSSMIDLEVVDDISEQQLQSYIEKHSKFTKSKIAKHILTNWDKEIKYFIKVMPQDLKRVLMEKEQQLEKHKKLV